MQSGMSKQIIQKIFTGNNLGEVKSVEKMTVGFTNTVYSINNTFILKVCENEANEKNFAKEAFFYNFFKNIIPVPQVITYDDTKTLYNKNFIIYYKIIGDNLYTKWHVMTNAERKNVINQLCNILQKINDADYREYAKNFHVSHTINWKNVILSKIKKSLQELKTKNILTKDVIVEIQKFVQENAISLDEQKIAFVYWDAHFDNILVKNNNIVGILDFERTELASIDFGLDIFKRMMEQPQKYMSEECEKFAKKEDYTHLLEWIEEFYPKMFAFKNLKQRLDLYSIEHDLHKLTQWPNAIELKQQLAKTIRYSKKQTD
ncbi:MAG: hypothetical protein CR972_04800 [Candidatus Moraniibacteriota bacterium]|nr:MAG: hypothetical protein CR972_04800 [Candidatus Moranbacteria bacterium]